MNPSVTTNFEARIIELDSIVIALISRLLFRCKIRSQRLTRARSYPVK